MHVTRPPSPASPAWTAAPPLPALTRPGAHARALWPAWLEGVLARAAERHQLHSLQERDLRDIGLTSAEAWALARKPLWRG